MVLALVQEVQNNRGGEEEEQEEDKGKYNEQGERDVEKLAYSILRTSEYIAPAKVRICVCLSLMVYSLGWAPSPTTTTAVCLLPANFDRQECGRCSMPHVHVACEVEVANSGCVCWRYSWKPSAHFFTSCVLHREAH